MFALEENPWQVLFVSHHLLEWFDKHGKKLWLFVPNYQNIKYGEITGLITSNVKRLKFWNRSYKLVLIDKFKTNQILEYFFDLSFKAGELYITQKIGSPSVPQLLSSTHQFHTKRPLLFNPSNALCSTPKSPLFHNNNPSVPHNPQFHTRNPSVPNNPQFHTKNPSVPHNPQIHTTLSSTPETPQLNTPLRSRLRTPQELFNWGGFGVELRGFWYWTEGFMVLTWGILGAEKVSSLYGTDVSNWWGLCGTEGYSEKSYKL